MSEPRSPNFSLGLRARRRIAAGLVACLGLGGLAACSSYTTQRDKTVKGASVGAVVGAGAAVAAGRRQAGQILTGAAIGAVAGGAVGAYMDRQEERIARIPGTQVERVADDTLLVYFDSDVLFAFDSASLNARSRRTLEEVAGVIHEFNRTAVVIQGHTDSTGSESYNQRLSERRAASVYNDFVGRGIAPARMAAVGYGESMPVASNATEAGRQLNRRVEVLLRAKAR